MFALYYIYCEKISCLWKNQKAAANIAGGLRNNALCSNPPKCRNTLRIQADVAEDGAE